ncbi:ribulokinase [Cutibacterium acnes HL050PA2]|nr:ribulokinase [Cutibacterium acnes HL050PA2]
MGPTTRPGATRPPREEDTMNNNYVVGLDFGTLSGRAVVVRANDGAEMGGRRP